ncbi:hypothetical protein HMPREF1550_00136 [Actinomyces sp. oral taxon 877 str. F0543]|nr:hypothetical protein HMPREF1550_00136 [Actinomyces sp. oral taxon 877 str. F0543]
MNLQLRHGFDSSRRDRPAVRVRGCLHHCPGRTHGGSSRCTA